MVTVAQTVSPGILIPVSDARRDRVDASTGADLPRPGNQALADREPWHSTCSLGSTMRFNGLPPLRDLPITFKRRAATPGFEKIVGKESDGAKHSPYEYVSTDGRWILRSVQHTGYGSTLGGRVRWYASCDGRLFPLRFSGGCYTLSMEDAVDTVHKRIGQGLCDGFAVLAKMRKAAKAKQQAAELHAANLVKARDLLGRMYGAEPTRMVEALAAHVNLDALARAVESASQVEGDAA